MSIYYLDTSAVVKQYVNEAGSDWMRNLVAANPPHLLISLRLLVVELTSALARRLREKTITREVFRGSLSAFEEDCRFEFHLLDVTAETINLARDLLIRHPLRSYDALHLAGAVSATKLFRQAALPPLIFLSADKRLIAAAKAEGLAADNPADHA